MYLLNTNLFSELRKPRSHGAVLAWLAPIAATDIFISAVTLAEIQAVIEITREEDAAKAQEIAAWANQVSASFRVLRMITEAYRLGAKLMHKQSAALYEDAMIAATAITRKLTVVTRNVRDFARFDVLVIKPFV